MAENLTRAEIEALASEIAKESASSITNELLSGREIFDSQALIDEINALIDNKIGSDYLTGEDLNKLKADILQSASDTISDELDAVLDKSLIELSNNMTINSEEKSSFISNLESEILNYINSDPSLKGVDGKDGTTPVKGTDYFTAADISEIQSIVETNIATLKSKDLIITGADGSDGKSAYELALDNGFVGTQEEWMDSLMPVAGEDFYTDAEITELKNQIVTQALSEIDVALKSITGSESLEESILNIETNISALKSQMSEIENNVTDISDQTDALNFQINTVLSDVTDIKSGLVAAIKSYAETGNQSLSEDSSFSEIQSSIGRLTSLQKEYYYDKTTGLKDSNLLVRYVKEGSNYYLCDENGIKTSTDPVTPTTNNLVKYVLADNLSMSAGYATINEKALYLGDGHDNIESYNEGYASGFIDGKLSVNTNGQIVYTYHEHSTACNGPCGGYYQKIDRYHVNGPEGYGLNYWTHDGVCNRCGYNGGDSTYNQTTPCTRIVLKCGKAAGSIESATIVY